MQQILLLALLFAQAALCNAALEVQLTAPNGIHGEVLRATRRRRSKRYDQEYTQDDHSEARCIEFIGRMSDKLEKLGIRSPVDTVTFKIRFIA